MGEWGMYQNYLPIKLKYCNKQHIHAHAYVYTLYTMIQTTQKNPYISTRIHMVCKHIFSYTCNLYNNFIEPKSFVHKLLPQWQAIDTKLGTIDRHRTESVIGGRRAPATEESAAQIPPGWGKTPCFPYVYGWQIQDSTFLYTLKLDVHWNIT